MQRSGSQKVLLVISILSIIGAVLVLLSGLAMMMGGALFGSIDSSEAASALAGTDITQDEAGVIAGMLGIIVIFSGVVELIMGILGVRAANNSQKIMPVWVFAIIEVILCVIGLASTVADGTFSSQGVSTVISLVFAVLILWIANNIKKEAGK